MEGWGVGTSRWWGCPVPAGSRHRHKNTPVLQHSDAVTEETLLLYALGTNMHNTIVHSFFVEQRKENHFRWLFWFSITAKCWISCEGVYALCILKCWLFSKALRNTNSYSGRGSPDISAADQTFFCPRLCPPSPSRSPSPRYVTLIILSG